MSLDRSPSPQHDGGWATPGLAAPYDSAGESRSRGVSPSMNGGHGVSWATAKANSDRVKGGYPRYQSRNQGWFARMGRKASVSLPFFAHGGQEDRYAEKEKLQRGRLGRDGGGFDWKELSRRAGLLLSRRRKYAALLVLVICLTFFFGSDCEYTEATASGTSC